MLSMKLVRRVLHILILIPLQTGNTTYKGMVKFKNFQLKPGLACLNSQKCLGRNDKGCGTKSCETLISICLIKKQSSSKGVCLLQSNSTKEMNDQDFEIKFPGIFGEPMNLVLKGILKDSTGHNVVFEERFHHSLTFIKSSWNEVPSTNYTIQGFEYKLSCKKNLYGRKCNTYCKPSDSAIAGYWSCSNDGQRLCKPGWYGKFCNEQCQCSSQGKCIGKICKCNPGWTGQYCTKEMCASVKCNNGGSCNKFTGLCQCLPDFTGKFCETNIPKQNLSKSYSPSSLTTRNVFASSIQVNSIHVSILKPVMKTATFSASLSPSITVFSTKSNQLSASLSIDKFVPSGSIITTTKSLIEPQKNITKYPQLISSFSYFTLLYTYPVRSKYTNIGTNSTGIDGVNILISSTTSVGTKFNYTIIIAVVVVLILLLVAILLLRKQKKQNRRKSKASAITPISSNDETFESRCSISSARPITPLIGYLFERGTGVGAESSDLDAISSHEYPVIDKVNTNADVDRICMETIRGQKRSRNGTIKPNTDQQQQITNRDRRNARVSKTSSNGSRKSQTSSSYCSSGYCSGTSSPSPLRPDRLVTSYIIPYIYRDEGYQNNSKCKASLLDCLSSVEKDGGNDSNSINDSSNIKTNNTLNQERRLSYNNIKRSSVDTVFENLQQQQQLERRKSSTASSSEFHHSRQATLNSVKFKDLPNFVTYKEDSF